MQTPAKPKVQVIKRVDPYAKLPKDAKKKIARLIKLAKLQGKIPRSAQRTIPYRDMLRNGICRVSEDFYTKTVEFFDTNYRLAKQETKEHIFESWCRFLNYFDSSVSVQLCFVNQAIDVEQFYKAIEIPECGDTFDELRREYVAMLQDQLAKGNNGLLKRKFLTFGIHAETPELAQLRLDRMEAEVINNFKVLINVTGEHQNGYERLEVLHDIFNIGTDRKLNFNWGLIPETGLTTKDFIAMNSLNLKDKNIFELQERVGRSSYLRLTAQELTDDILAEFLEMDSPAIISIHLRSIEQTAAKKYAGRQLANLNAQKAEEQKKASTSGYDMDMLPYELKNNVAEAESLMDSLHDRNERMFMMTFTLTQFAEDKEKLKNVFDTAKQIAQQHDCELLPLDWQQEAGLMSAVPIGINEVQNERMMTTSGVAAFVPFQTQELFQTGGLYYGVNAISQNMIMVDRLSGNNPNGLILGVPGSGKSFSAKREMVNVALVLNDDILILDPEREYTALVNALGGQVIKISADSRHHINPMDINLTAKSSEDTDFDPVRDKCDFMLSFCEQALSTRDGLQPIEVSVIDRCVMRIYDKFMLNPLPENTPTLQDLYNLLREQEEPEAKRIATGLERFVTGSLNIFNHQTNVQLDNRIVCFDIKDLAKNLKKLGMLVVQDQIWSRVRDNRVQGKVTRYYVDEFHLLLKDAQTAAASVEIWKRFRKWGGVPTGITQNVKDFLMSAEIENIFENSDFVYLLSQASGDQRILASALNISEDQLSYVTNSQPGEGLLIFKKESAIIPFIDRFPKDTLLYRLMTTKLDEVVAV